MSIKAVLALALVSLAIPVAASNVIAGRSRVHRGGTAAATRAADGAPRPSRRVRADVAAMQAFRPGYRFWRHVFTIPDGSIAFGSAVDGRSSRRFRRKEIGHGGRSGRIHRSPARSTARRLRANWGSGREQSALLLERAAGPVLHNSTRGDAPHGTPRWLGPSRSGAPSTEGLGVPADIGLAQVIFESGLSGTRRSNANAVGFCQWQRKNWKRLATSPYPIQERNQTTQAPYCAAYLSVLAAKYGSFIPALSEHNAGGTNVGRALITGEYLGGADVTRPVPSGSQLARDLRTLPGLRTRLRQLWLPLVSLRGDGLWLTRTTSASRSRRYHKYRSTPCARRARFRGRDHQGDGSRGR